MPEGDKELHQQGYALGCRTSVRVTLGDNTFDAHADDLSQLSCLFNAWLQAQSNDADAVELARLTAVLKAQTDAEAAVVAENTRESSFYTTP